MAALDDSDCSWRETARVRVTRELEEPSNLRACDRVAERRDTIVSTTLVVGAGATLLDLDDHPLLDHADRPIGLPR